MLIIIAMNVRYYNFCLQMFVYNFFLRFFSLPTSEKAHLSSLEL